MTRARFILAAILTVGSIALPTSVALLAGHPSTCRPSAIVECAR